MLLQRNTYWRRAVTTDARAFAIITNDGVDIMSVIASLVALVIGRPSSAAKTTASHAVTLSTAARQE